MFIGNKNGKEMLLSTELYINKLLSYLRNPTKS